MPRGINLIYIVLIPKIKNPKRVSNFRPIGLINVIYKITFKVLVNYVKLIISQVISKNQCSFVADTLITNNMLMVYETMHYLNRKRRRKKGTMALKLDISKTYDQVEWSFLKSVMEKMGFVDQWISLVMRCVITTNFSVLLNRAPRGFIVSLRGIR